MVNKPTFRVIKGGPPPLDESWWQAVLAEEESQKGDATPRKSAPAGAGRRPGETRPIQEPTQVDWQKAKALYEQDLVTCLKVIGCNRGGVLVNGDGLQGFVPVSHLVDAHDAEGIEKLEAYMDRSLRLKVIECDPQHGRIVFSERAALAEPGSRNQILEELHSGCSVWGSVTNITDFGVFVDLGGIEGLVHVSEISWGRVRHPSDVVSLGDRVKVFVINVDQERARVALSLKRLYPNPWETAEQRYIPGEVVEAVITTLAPFGAFARLEEGLDGLIHISEMHIGGEDGPARPEEILEEGQRVLVKILHVDGDKQRLGLSLVPKTE